MLLCDAECWVTEGEVNGVALRACDNRVASLSRSFPQTLPAKNGSQGPDVICPKRVRAYRCVPPLHVRLMRTLGQRPFILPATQLCMANEA